MAARVESSNVADQGDERRSGEEADAGHCLEERDVRELPGQSRQLPFDGAHIRFEHANLVTGARQRRAHEYRHDRGLAEQFADTGHDVLGPDRNEDTELAKQAPHRVQSGRARREPRRAETVQGRDRLVLDRLDRHWMNLVIARRFEQRFRVGAVRFIASHVPMHIVSRQQPDHVATLLELPRSMMRRAARF